MQSWQSQNGGDGNGNGNNSWQQDYNFSTQNGQFDQTQSWGQHMPGQDQNTFARQLNPSDPSANLFHDPNILPNYQDGHGTFDLNQHFNGQDVIDPAFSNVHPDLYAQQNKMDLGGSSMHHLGQVQGHTQEQNQSFPPQAFNTFDAQPQHDQQFASNAPQYSQAQLLPQTARQQTHTPSQQFSSIQPNFATQLRPSHTPPAQQRNQQYPQNSSFPPPQINGHGAQYQQGQASQMNFQQPSAYSPASFDASQFQSQTQQQFTPPVQHQQVDPGLVRQVRSHDGTPQPQTAPFEQTVQAAVSDGPAKKRQRITKAAPTTFSPVPEALPHSIGSPVEPIGKRMEELDALVPPISTPEEIKLLQKFQKRGKAAQVKFPTIKGLPHLAHEGTVKLPAPKSYDKLAPLVAVPSRSKKPVNPEAGYGLPSEIQGRFTSQYRPAFDRIGLDERRAEASSLLDDFDQSMKALGKRRPKYTEYPHSFKEQLKADEAFKNKRAKRELEEVRSKPIRPTQRPLDPVEAAAWDIIGIVHLEHAVTKSSSIVAQRVQQAGDFFIKLRGEVNRAKQAMDKAIEERIPELEIAQLRKQHETSRDALHRAFDATIEHADDSVIDNLGGHQKLVLSLVNVLIACIKASDFKGKLPKVVLELITHFPMTRKIAETTNFDTVRKRFLDKGDDDIKELAREITQNIKKMKQAEESTGYTGTSSASRAKLAAKGAAPAKRARDEDGSSDGRSVKKVAVESGSGSLSKKLAQPKLQLTSASKNPAAKSSTPVLGERGRPASKPAARPESTPRVQSPDDKAKTGPKKPAVKAETAKIAPSKSNAKPPAPVMGAAPSSSALSGIGSLLASINTTQPKTPPSAPKETKDFDGPETEEEKTKRLRKESRRKLRVSWKPEGELVDIKIFEKEDDEDEGRDSNMIRDAADDKSEGMVLKQRGRIEDEDDDDEEIPYQPWTVPYLLDLSYLEEHTKDKSYMTRGGNLALTTEEQRRIDEHENSALLAIYTTVDDIPATPKSPKPESTTLAPKVVHVPEDDPKVHEIKNRWRDAEQMGPDGAFYTASSRLNTRAKGSPLDNILGSLQGAASQHQPGAQQHHAAHATRGGTDTNVPLAVGPALTEEVLAWLRSDKAKRWVDPSPVLSNAARVYNYVDANMAAIGAFVEPISKALADKPYPATKPPDWMSHDLERVREWWTGFVKEAAVRQKRAADEERGRAEAAAAAQRAAAPAVQDQATQEWLAWYAQQPPEQQQAYAPYLAALQQMNGGQTHNAQAQPPPQAQPQDPQLAAILSAMSQPQGQQPLQPAPSQGGYQLSDPSYQQMAVGGQPHHLSPADDRAHDRGWDHDYDRDHQRDNDRDWERQDSRDRGYDRNDDYSNRGHKNKSKDNKKPGPATIHKPPNASLIGTKPCTFWQQGKCARGDKCTFKHD